MGAADNQAPDSVEKEIVSELFPLWNFVFLTSCQRLSYQVPPEFFFEKDMSSQFRSIVQLL